MREILFRGICTETKQWVFGSKYNDFIISYLEVDKFLKESDLFQCNCVIRDVVPETIGQFTGLTDKNGVKIFEGDKVVLRGHECFVFYRRGYCDFTFENEKYGGRSLNVTKSNITRYNVEIIGNIHDHATL